MYGLLLTYGSMECVEGAFLDLVGIVYNLFD